ncbi:PREDICTED: 39S ribosomal protein L47, mitochondrial-like [Branchiostoma belcheri]|uniref:Large ribosomal subunit protein uL29m n=1 Tax=Branchiostoma belcheri TaxID=7741 RepID=A0A6P4Z7R8_BRABE|nr:PREDICTED: 39S ribosomal protein L47, mitochondrial-like [Branchiostoma belcheri]
MAACMCKNGLQNSRSIFDIGRQYLGARFLSRSITAVLTPQRIFHRRTFQKLLLQVTPTQSTSVQAITLVHTKALHTSSFCHGAEEFFDDPKNWGEKNVKHGDAWTLDQLRQKSNVDLWKLWYVLLKERNMLLTLEHEARRQVERMPSEERLDKVTESMEHLIEVLLEREKALRLLKTGREEEVPGKFLFNVFGQKYYRRFKPYPMPVWMNTSFNKRYWTFPTFVEYFIRLREEKQQKRKFAQAHAERRWWAKMVEKFPNLRDQKTPWEEREEKKQRDKEQRLREIKEKDY